MKREKLEAKWFDKKKRPNDYDPFTLFNMIDENNRKVDIAMIMSGRNRAKSFRISTYALMEAYYNKKQFGYIRRFKQEMTANKVEQYFMDKQDFIKDMTDDKYQYVICYQGKLYFGGRNAAGDTIKSDVIGYVFGVNVSQEYKSLQYPDIYTLIYEEVFTIEKYATDEPAKLMSIISTVKRSKEDFKVYLISNTVSRVNPYSLAWALTKLNRQKQGTIDRYKLMLPELDDEGNQAYLFIALEYLEDSKGEVEFKKSILGKADNIVANSIISNDWDINYIYVTLHQDLIKNYEINATVIFEHDLFKFKVDLIQIPINLYEQAQLYNEGSIDNMMLLEETFPILYVSRKTTKIESGTRVYSDRVYLTNTITSGFVVLNKLDSKIKELINNGWVAYTDQLTANEFNQCLEYLL